LHGATLPFFFRKAIRRNGREKARPQRQAEILPRWLRPRSSSRGAPRGSVKSATNFFAAAHTSTRVQQKPRKASGRFVAKL